MQQVITQHFMQVRKAVPAAPTYIYWLYQRLGVSTYLYVTERTPTHIDLIVYNSVSIQPDEVEIVEDAANLFKKFWKNNGATKFNKQQEVMDKAFTAKYTKDDKDAVERFC